MWLNVSIIAREAINAYHSVHRYPRVPLTTSSVHFSQ